jgi:hypothetical protein
MNPLPFGAPPSLFLDDFAELRRQESKKTVPTRTLLNKATSLEEFARGSLMHRIEVQDETNRSHGITPAERENINNFKKQISTGVDRAVRSHKAAQRAVEEAKKAEQNPAKTKTALRAFQAAKKAIGESLAWGKNKEGGTLRRKHRKSAKQRKSVKHRRS